MTDNLGIRGFARRKGVAPSAVSKAISNGRLERSVTLDARSRPQISVTTGDTEWEENRNVAMDRLHNHVKARQNGVPLSALNGPVRAVYELRELFGAIIDPVFRLRASKADCALFLAFLQRFPVLLREIEDGMAEGGIPLFPEGHPR